MLRSEQVLAGFNGRLEFDAVHQMLTNEKEIQEATFYILGIQIGTAYELLHCAGKM